MSDRNVDMLESAGTAWSLAEDVVREMRATQAALMSGDTRIAHEHFERGRRLAQRLNDTLTPATTPT